MRRFSTEVKSQGESGRDRLRSSSTAAKRSRQRRLTIDSLEERALMATAPISVVTNNANVTSHGLNSNSNDSSPFVAVDPLDSTKLVSVYTNRDTSSGNTIIRTHASYSADGGLTWSSLSLPGLLFDPTTTTNPATYSESDGMGVQFDRNHQVYIGTLEHNSGNNSGAVLLEKYDFSGGSANFSVETNVYQWNQTITTPDLSKQPSIVNFAFAVDNNLSTFTDPKTGIKNTDAKSGAVYIAWTANTPPPSSPPNPYNPFTIQVVASADGTTFPAGNNSPTGPGTQISGGNFGNQRYTAPQVVVSQGKAGAAGGGVTVIWDDFGSGAGASPAFDIIQARSFTFNTTTSAITLGGTSNVATPLVRGAVSAPYARGSAASPIGIGPGAVLAVDNTLGSFSSTAGNLYIAYTDYANNTGNPTDNTDIYFAKSTNGGSSWTITSKINDDLGTTDGFSGANGSTAGRSQFEPSIAVDNTNGTVALSWLDSRDDATKTRYASYLATSIDAGGTFSKNTYTNTPNSVIDAITGKAQNVGPQMDISTESSLSFGSHQAIAISNGVIHPVWSGTRTLVNGRVLGDGFNGTQLGIQTAQATYPIGPRIISSTMGPVASTTVSGLTFNNTFTLTDHTQQVDGFSVTFDRPVDISTFTAADISVIYRDTTTPLSSPGTAISVGSVTPLDSAFGGTEATTFFVRFTTKQSKVGTYSYSVGPNISDRLWSPPAVVVTPNGPTKTETAVGPQVPQSYPDSPTFNPQTVNSTITVIDQPIGSVLAALTVTIDVKHHFDSDLIISLISPAGTTLILSNRHGTSQDDYSVTTFDSNAATPIASGSPPYNGTFAPDSSLGTLNGGPTNGTWTLGISDVFGFDGLTLNSWSMKMTPGVSTVGVIAAHTMDQNANGRNDIASTSDVFSVPTPLGSTPFQAPYDTTTLPIIVPGPHMVGAFVPGVGLPSALGTDNLVLNATNKVLNVVFDRDIDPTSFTPAQILRVVNPYGAVVPGPFTVAPETSVANLQADEITGGAANSHHRTFRITLPVAQQISGTYTIQLGSGIKSAAGDLVDTNLNAGVDLLFQKSTGATSNVTYTTDTPLNLVNGVIDTTRPTTSTITVNDNYLIQPGTQVGVSIVFPHDPDLTGTLTFTPSDTSINPVTVTLFSGVGNVGAIATQQNFTNTTFNDSLTNVPIQNGSAPFTGTFNPQSPLSAFNGLAANGTFTLTITNTATGQPATGLLTNFTLRLTKLAATGFSTGLGEPVADQSTASFRLFTMDSTNPLSSNTWTAVGGASNNSGGNSGRIGGIAVDPSDPSGNTVYVAGASGGVWKTNNFLTQSASGPTYVPLTDAAATNGINVGSIAVFGRNNDTNQSIVIVGTGEGDTTSPGVGFLISYNGGATWNLLDSLKNYNPDGTEIPEAQRDRKFVGNATFKVIVDPRPTATGDVVFYAAMAGPNGGIYRSLNSGRDWTLMRAGFATDITFDPNSGRIDAFSNPTGNLRTLYAAFQGDGVYISANQAASFALMAGGVGDPLLTNFDSTSGQYLPIVVNAPAATPNGGKGRIVLVHPALTGNAIQDLGYEGWLYAAVSAADGHFDGLYMTKDNGQNWVKARVANGAPKAASGLTTALVPTNDISNPDYDILGGQGNYDIGLTIDPNNPEVVYIGGSRDFGPATMIRVDVSRIADAHSVFFDSTRSTGTLENTTDPIKIFDINNIFATNVLIDPLTNPYKNLIRNPGSPFLTTGTVLTADAGNLANTGSGVRYTPLISFLGGQTDIHRMLAIKDPISGKTRLLIGLDQGIFSGVDDGTGTQLSSIGTQALVNGARNGNIQITQIYNGAAQPSVAAAQIAGALFYGVAQDDGFPQSDPNVLTNGNINATGSTGDGTAVSTDATGSGASYFYKWPCCGGGSTDFFSVRPNTGGSATTEYGRTNGLIQSTTGPVSPLGGPRDPQWPSLGGFNFAVNPVNPNAVIIGSGAGRLFGTEDQGQNWFVLADPSTLDSSVMAALAYGAPDPVGQGTPGAVDNYIMVGTARGHAFVTFNGGGAWKDISAGLDGNSVIRIVTDPNRGTHDAYATTSGGVFYNPDTSAANSSWTNITGNLFQQMTDPFGDATLRQQQLLDLGGVGVNGGLAADFRYVIPNNPNVVGGPTHPMLYVSGTGGVFRSTDLGLTWSIFPASYQSPSNVALNLTTTAGGYLPNVQVASLSLSLGNVDPTTGRPNVATGPNIMMAATYGRGEFAIRLAPIVFNDAVNKINVSANVAGQPVISGLSEQTAYGNVVNVNLIDVTDPANPITIGSATTDAFGKFKVTAVYPVAPANNPYVYSGIRNIQVSATDGSGTKGNVVTFNLTNNPATPAAPTLLSNRVVSNGVNITDVTNPSFNVIIPNNNTIPVSVALIRTDSAGVSRTVSTTTITGTGSVTDPGPVPIGTFTYKVQYSVQVGALTVTSLGSPVSTLKIVPSITAALLPTDDSGLAGDLKTNVTTPHFFGVAPSPLATPSDLSLNLISVTAGGNVLLGTVAPASYPNNGNYVIQVSAANKLIDGTYSIIVQAADAFGNNLSSKPVTLVIKTAPPTGNPSLNILSTDDSGIVGDGKTNVRRPRLVGTTDPGNLVNILDAKGNILATATASSFAQNGKPAGYYSVQLSANLNNGTIPLYAVATDIEGNTTPKPVNPSLNLVIYGITGDYNGDGKADLVTYRYKDPVGFKPTATVTSTVGTWTIQNSGGAVSKVIRGITGDVPVPGDYSGTGQTLTAVFRPSTDTWYIGTAGVQTVIQLGTVGKSVPVPATYDATLRTNVATYDPATQTWVVLLNATSGALTKTTYKFAGGVYTTPAATDKAVPGDYQNTGGIAQFALYRPSTGQWFVRDKTTGNPVLFASGVGGVAGDIPVQADFDGIGRTEPAVYRPSTGQFIVFNPTAPVGSQITSRKLTYPTGFSFQAADVPAALDYDGDGKLDLAVYRPSTGNLFINYSSTNQAVFSPQGTVNADIPPQTPLTFRVSTIQGTTGTTVIPAATGTATTAPKSTTIIPAAVSIKIKSAVAKVAPHSTAKAKATPHSKVKVVINHNSHKPAALHTNAKTKATPADHALASLGNAVKGRFIV